MQEPDARQSQNCQISATVVIVITRDHSRDGAGLSVEAGGIWSPMLVNVPPVVSKDLEAVERGLGNVEIAVSVEIEGDDRGVPEIAAQPLRFGRTSRRVP